MNVLSLFDGMSVGLLSLEKSGIKVSNYFASEIKKEAIKLSESKNNGVIQIGDVTKVSYKDGVLFTEKGSFEVGNIDMVIGGSPCQDFSIANKNQTGLKGVKSSLFFEFLRILNEVKPTYFLLENVSSMKKDDKRILDGYMGCVGKEINTINFLPQNRKRLYWTNINYKEVKDCRILNFQDILESGYVEREYSTCLSEAHSRPTVDKLRLTRRNLEKSFIPIVYKDENHYKEVIAHYNNHYRGLSAKQVDEKRDSIDNSVYNGVRILSQLEMERLQGVPEGYTKILSRNESASLLGDGWTVDVISHIFDGLKTDD